MRSARVLMRRLDDGLHDYARKPDDRDFHEADLASNTRDLMRHVELSSIEATPAHRVRVARMAKGKA
jgi:hypothetical protein